MVIKGAITERFLLLCSLMSIRCSSKLLYAKGACQTDHRFHYSVHKLSLISFFNCNGFNNTFFEQRSGTVDETTQPVDVATFLLALLDNKASKKCIIHMQGCSKLNAEYDQWPF